MKKRVLIVGGILIAVGIAGGVGWRYYSENIMVASDQDIAYVTKISTLTDTSSGVVNRFAGVVEPQQTVEVNIESGRTIKDVMVETGDVVRQGQLLFEYDLSSIEEDIQETQLELDRLKNEALSLTDQISTLEKEKKKASKDSQLSYTIEIETNKMNLKKNEYDQKSKAAELERLQNATGNTEVRSEIDGVIQKIDTAKMANSDGDSLDFANDYYSYGSDNAESDAFITILSTGAYQIKGSINEQNMQSIFEGDSVIVFSRVDDKQTWKGVISTIDRENNTSGNSNSNMYYGMSSDSMTSSSSYPFYIELENSDGLMLGQHVYIEKDNGQAEAKTGLWLSEFYIADLYETSPYVWAADENGRLEKREITLGEYDPEMMEYEIVEGLSTSDSIAFPDDTLKEGMKTADSSMQPDISEDYPDEGLVDMEVGNYDESYEVMEDWGEDFEYIDDEFMEGEFIEDDFVEEDFMEEDFMDEEFTEEFFEDEVEVLE